MPIAAHRDLGVSVVGFGVRPEVACIYYDMRDGRFRFLIFCGRYSSAVFADLTRPAYFFRYFLFASQPMRLGDLQL